jgi:hypothetical protein
MRVVGYRIDELGWINEGVFPTSNLRPWSELWRLGLLLSGKVVVHTGLWKWCWGSSPELGEPTAMECHWRRGFFLRVWGVAAKSFFLPWSGDSWRWRLATTSLLPLGSRKLSRFTGRRDGSCSTIPPGWYRHSAWATHGCPLRYHVEDVH